jgi:hypothetical protein
MSNDTIPPEIVFLSNKKNLSANQGIKYDDLYYSNMNSTVQLVESVTTTNKFKQSLQSLQFGSSSMVTFQNSSFLGRTMLHLELPPLEPNLCLPKGWGWRAIQSIEFQFGSSSVNNVTISGITMFHMLLAQCTNSEAASELLRLGGEETLTPLPFDPEVPDSNRPSADIVLILPWSNVHGGQYAKLPFDTSLLSQPITVTIQFRNSNEIYGGSGLKPNSLHSATIMSKLTDLTNKTLGLKYSLMRNPDLSLVYPFMHYTLFSSAPFQGRKSGQPCRINLQGFLNADLFGFVISVHKSGDLVNTNGNVINPFNSDAIRDITVQYNGETIYYSQKYGYRLLNCESNTGASYVHNSVIAPGTGQPFISSPVDTYLLYVDFSRLRSAAFNNHFANTSRLPAQVLDISFFTSSTDEYKLYCTYIYPAIAEIGQAGVSDIYYI